MWLNVVVSSKRFIPNLFICTQNQTDDENRIKNKRIRTDEP